MPYTRRSFLHLLTAAGVASAYAQPFAQMQMPMPAPPPRELDIFNLPPFLDALPLPQIIQARAGQRIQVAMREIHAPLHRNLPPARMWSYGPTALAPVIEARSGIPVEVEWVNHLPEKHFLPIDHTLHGCGTDLPEVRACVHLHGGRTPSADDGYPDDWYVPGRSRVCRYPMQQEAAALWIHDHAMGINRLNIYAGLFGMFLVRDAAEDALHLPRGRYELPLILYDRELTAEGQLYYPVSDDPAKPWVPEFTGDAIIINGKIRPYVEVEPRLYRLRILNSANSRFFGLSSTAGPLLQIGSDQGLLAVPVAVNRLTLAPGERADILLDLSALAGERVHLRNGALDILEFRVAGPAKHSTIAARIPKTLRPVERMPESAAIATRRITLNEYQDDHGRSMVMLLNRQHWHEPVTERPRLNTTEIWEFVNQTQDTHPMHLHLVRFQVLDRRPFDPFAFMMRREMIYTGPAVTPPANEMGWKDVVQCEPGVVTRIIVRFEGYTGNYLYHCHILEHEANDMMRPFEVIA
ncbi:MAG: multicopper oxidase domain-containing protein [Acidobacteriaceae bacterium]|nr:multicopper oxidase domain-containing protein [Acidobacteriaceae bacterium]